MQWKTIYGKQLSNPCIHNIVKKDYGKKAINSDGPCESILFLTEQIAYLNRCVMDWIEILC